MEKFTVIWFIKVADVIKVGNEVIKSRKFRTIHNGLYFTWQLGIYPNEKNTDGNSPKAESCTIYLYLTDVDEKFRSKFVNAAFSFEIATTARDYDDDSATKRLFVDDGDGSLFAIAKCPNDAVWGFTKFADAFGDKIPSHVTLYPPIADQRIRLECEIRIRRETFDASQHYAYSKRIDDGDEIRRRQFNEDLFNGIRNGDEFSKRVTLVSRDQAKFLCHRLILAEQSVIFRRMFENTNFDEISTVSLPDIDGHVLEQCLRFVYTGEIVDEKFVEILAECLYVAEKYAFQNLKEKCSKFIGFEINGDNVLDIMNLAEKFSVNSLKISCVHNFIVLFEMLRSTEQFDTVMKQRPDLVTYLLKSVCSQLLVLFESDDYNCENAISANSLKILSVKRFVLSMNFNPNFDWQKFVVESTGTFLILLDVICYFINSQSKPMIFKH